MANLPEKSKSIQYLENLSLEQALQTEVVTWLKNYSSVNTRKNYNSYVTNFIRTLQLQEVGDFKKVRQLDVIYFRDKLVQRGESNRSVNVRLSAVKMLFKHLKERGYIEVNPAEQVERMKVDQSVGETPAMTKQQARTFLNTPNTTTIQGARDSAILHLLFYTGSRVTAPTTLKIKDFYEDQGFYVLKWKKKGGQNQVIPVPPALIDALRRYLNATTHKNNPDSPLFAPVKLSNNDGSKGLSSQTFLNIWNKYLVQSGIPTHFTPHSARATFATTADENGVPIQDIQKALGHSDISTTQNYVHSRKKHKDSAVFRVNY